MVLESLPLTRALILLQPLFVIVLQQHHVYAGEDRSFCDNNPALWLPCLIPQPTAWKLPHFCEEAL